MGAARPAVARPVALVAGWLLLAGAPSPAHAVPSNGITELVSVSAAGAQGNDASRYPAISADGRFVAFASTATNLVPGTGSRRYHVYGRGQTAADMRWISASSGDHKGRDGESVAPSVSADGRTVAYQSSASNLVHGDTNLFKDVFVYDRGTGGTARVSVNSGGGQGNSASLGPSAAALGGSVSFTSWASNLVAGDTNGAMDVFVHDRVAGRRTTRASVSSAGSEGNAGSFEPSISAGGRFVAFTSEADNLVGGDANRAWDVFVRDRAGHTTTRVSVDSYGGEASAASWAPSISADGRYVAFHSGASNLVPGDSNGRPDVFVHDRLTLASIRVSVSSSGAEADLDSYAPSISADGRFVAFHSLASNLVPADRNGREDVFVHDGLTGATRRVSVSSSGAEGNRASTDASISADGRRVAFWSSATNLVPGDTNGVPDVFVRRTLG